MPRTPKTTTTRNKKPVLSIVDNTVVNPEETPVVGLEYVPGTASDVLLNLAHGHYQKFFTVDGEMVLYDRHANKTMKLTDEVRYLMEVIEGYEIIETYY